MLCDIHENYDLVFQRKKLRACSAQCSAQCTPQCSALRSAVRCNAVQGNVQYTVQCTAQRVVQCSVHSNAQCNAMRGVMQQSVQCNVQRSAVQCAMEQCSAALRNVAVHSAVHCTLYCALHCTDWRTFKRDASLLFWLQLLELSSKPEGVDEVRVWTGGPDNQFKNKFVMVITRLLSERHGVKLISNFSATSHSNGPVDWIGAALKRSATNQVKTSKCIINGAADFY